MTDPRIIQVAALVLTDGAGRVLTVRKHGTHRFMQPGGKPETGESALQTALRETHEEVGLALTAEQLHDMGEFRAAAANEPDHTVVCRTFRVEFDGDSDQLLSQLKPAAEIAEIRWIPVEQLQPAENLAPLLTQQIAPVLRAEASAKTRI